MAGIVTKLSYKRLKQEVIFEEDEDHDHLPRSKSKTERICEIIRRSSSSVRSRSRIIINNNNNNNWISKLKLSRKFKLKFKLGGFRRFFRIRRVNKLKVARLSWANKVFKRLKESQSHFGELFAGNYLFMQVTPVSLKNNNNVNHQIYNHNLSVNKLSRFPSTNFSSNYIYS